MMLSINSARLLFFCVCLFSNLFGFSCQWNSGFWVFWCAFFLCSDLLSPSTFNRMVFLVQFDVFDGLFSLLFALHAVDPGCLSNIQQFCYATANFNTQLNLRLARIKHSSFSHTRIISFFLSCFYFLICKITSRIVLNRYILWAPDSLQNVTENQPEKQRIILIAVEIAHKRYHKNYFIVRPAMNFVFWSWVLWNGACWNGPHAVPFVQ